MAFWSNAYKICTNDPNIFCCKLINMSIKNMTYILILNLLMLAL